MTKKKAAQRALRAAKRAAIGACPVPRPQMRSKDRELLSRARDMIMMMRESFSPKIEWGKFSVPVVDLLTDISIELDKP